MSDAPDSNDAAAKARRVIARGLVRTCRSIIDCAICPSPIRRGQKYFDRRGEYVHTSCAYDAIGEATPLAHRDDRA